MVLGNGLGVSVSVRSNIETCKQKKRVNMIVIH